MKEKRKHHLLAARFTAISYFDKYVWTIRKVDFSFSHTHTHTHTHTHMHPLLTSLTPYATPIHFHRSYKSLVQRRGNRHVPTSNYPHIFCLPCLDSCNIHTYTHTYTHTCTQAREITNSPHKHALYRVTKNSDSKWPRFAVRQTMSEQTQHPKRRYRYSWCNLLKGAGIAQSVYRLVRAGESGDRILVTARFSVTVQTGLGPTQTSVQWITGLFPGGKQPRRGVNHLPSSSAEVKERVYLCGPSWPVLCRNLPFTFSLLKDGSEWSED